VIDYCQKLIQSLEEDYAYYSSEINEPIELAEKLVELTIQKISELKKFIKHRGFNNVEEEIYFFKELKPKIVSKFIYYDAIYKIESKKPYIGNRNVKKYLKNELSKLKWFFDNNIEFYKYYRTNSDYLDHKFFVRRKHDIKLSPDSYYVESDHNFSTSHDFEVAKIMANEMIQIYLEIQLSNKKISNPSESDNSLTWTASKTDLIELIYALHVQGVFDGGNIEIKVIANYFEKIFNVDLGDYYHTFSDLKHRKKNPTKFLAALRNGLARKITEQE